MNPSDYVEQAILELLAQDEKIKALFYSHTYDETPIETLHQTHHKIKQWVERLSIIRDEIIEDAFDAEPTAKKEQIIFYLRRKNMDASARGVKTEPGFRVLRGSYISPYIAPNMYKVVKRLRQENTHNIDRNNHLTTDLDFDNAGQAARFVTGKQVNGLEEWRTDDGVSLKALKPIPTIDTVTPERHNEQPNNDEFTKKKPSFLILFGETHSVTYWRDVLAYTCEILYTKTPQIVQEFDKNNILNKKRPNFSWHKEAIKQQPMQLSFGLWVELNQSARTIMGICYKMLSECGFSSKDIRVVTR